MAKRAKTEDAKNDKKTRKESSTMLLNRRESVESDASDGVGGDASDGMDSDGVGGDASDGMDSDGVGGDGVESEADDPGDDSEACDDVESVGGDDVETTNIDPFKVHFEQLLTDHQVEQLAQNHPPSYTQSDVSVTMVTVTPSDTYSPLYRTRYWEQWS